VCVHAMLAHPDIYTYIYMRSAAYVEWCKLVGSRGHALVSARGQANCDQSCKGEGAHLARRSTALPCVGPCTTVFAPLAPIPRQAAEGLWQQTGTKGTRSNTPVCGAEQQRRTPERRRFKAVERLKCTYGMYTRGLKCGAVRLRVCECVCVRVCMCARGHEADTGCT